MVMMASGATMGQKRSGVVERRSKIQRTAPKMSQAASIASKAPPTPQIYTPNLTAINRLHVGELFRCTALWERNSYDDIS